MIIHLSNDLQKELKLCGSSIQLAKTIDGELPTGYAFYEPKKDRSFNISFTNLIKEYAARYSS